MSKIEQMIESLCPEGVEFFALEDLGDIYSGLSGKTKEDFGKGTGYFITYKNVFDNPAIDTLALEKVNISDHERQNEVVAGDILFTSSSETPDECGMSSVVLNDFEQKTYLNSFCFGFRLKNPEAFSIDYLKHLFRSQEVRKEISRSSSGVTRFNLSKKRFTKIKIPVPPLSIQKEIASILNSFAELEADLEMRLKAELEARKAQYAYYRDKLLDFSTRGGGSSNATR